MPQGGIYRGNREPNVDYFDDIMGDNSVPTIFSGSGMEQLESIQATSNPQGVMVDMMCRPPGCGKPVKILLEWPELFIAAHAPATGIVPYGWERSEENMMPYPRMNCSRCGNLIAPMVPPQWAKRQVDSALEAGLITQEELLANPVVQQWYAEVQGGGRPPPGRPPGGQFLG